MKELKMKELKMKIKKITNFFNTDQSIPLFKPSYPLFPIPFCLITSAFSLLFPNLKTDYFFFQLQLWFRVHDRSKPLPQDQERAAFP